MDVYEVAVPPQQNQDDPPAVWRRKIRALTEQAARDTAYLRFHKAFGYEPDPTTIQSRRV